jgi:hypothetical protein
MSSALNAWSSGRVRLCEVLHYTSSAFENCGPDQSRRCPLCAQGIGEYLIHNIRSKYDYTKYFLPPLRSNSPVVAVAGASSSNQRRPTRRERQWGQRERREQEVQDRLERAIRRRKWVYRHRFYAKVRAEVAGPVCPLTIVPHASTSRQTCIHDTDRSLRQLSLRLLRTTSAERPRSCGVSCKCGRALISKSVSLVPRHFR